LKRAVRVMGFVVGCCRCSWHKKNKQSTQCHPTSPRSTLQKGNKNKNTTVYRQCFEAWRCVYV